MKTIKRIIISLTGLLLLVGGAYAFVRGILVASGESTEPLVVLILLILGVLIGGFGLVLIELGIEGEDIGD